MMLRHRSTGFGFDSLRCHDIKTHLLGCISTQSVKMGTCNNMLHVNWDGSVVLATVSSTYDEAGLPRDF